MSEAYPKLIRHRIPDIIRIQEGVSPNIVHVRESSELRGLLGDKLDEEVAEYVLAETREHKTEELADIFEVLCAYVQIDDYTPELLLSTSHTRRSADIATSTSLAEISSRIRQCPSSSERLELCADALQIVTDFADEEGIRFDDVCEAREQKLAERGGFLDGVVMLEPV